MAPSLLAGLVYYEVEESSLTNGATSSSQERRRNTGRARRRALRASAPERILQIALTPASVTRWALYRDYDRCIGLLAVMMVHGGACVMLPFLFRRENMLLKPLGALTVLVSLFSLLKIEVTSSYAHRWDRWVLFMMFLVMAVISCKLLMALPKSFFYFNMDNVAIDMEKRLNNKTQEVNPKAEWRISVEFLNVMMSILGGVIGCVFFPASIRITRSAAIMQSQLSEMAVSLRCPPWFTPVHVMQDLSTAANCILWITPLTGLFQMKKEQLKIVQAWSCLLAAGSQMLMFRPLVQGYLNTGLISWYDETQQATNEEESDLSRRTVALNISKCSFFLCKAALQMLAPVMVLAPCGILLLWPNSRNVEYVYSICGFVVWWTNVVNFSVSAATLILARAGLVKL